MIEEAGRGGEPWMLLTGDSLFVGDLARPDLAVKAAEGARIDHVARTVAAPDRDGRDPRCGALLAVAAVV